MDTSFTNQLKQVRDESTSYSFVKKLKQNSELLCWIHEQTKHKLPPSATVSERGYYLLYGKPECPYGNNRKYLTPSRGYGYCARPEKCQCQKDDNSVNSQSHWAQKTKEQKNQIQKKRNKTNLEKYGVENVGQSQQAIDSRNETYRDPEKVKEIGRKIKATKLEMYGDENWVNLEKAKRTNMEKFGTEWSTMSDNYKEKRRKSTIRNAPEKEVMYDYEMIRELSENHTPKEIANKLGYKSSSSVLSCYKKFGLDDYKRGYIRSLYEDNIADLLTEWNIPFIRGSRKALDSKLELDFYIPDFNMAIEFNGVYWHSDKYKHKNYHQQKFIDAHNSGLKLLQVYEHNWINKNEIIIAKLRCSLNIDREYKHARKCNAKRITNSDSRNFLEEYHIQGYTNASHSYGLFCENGQLVAVASFSRPRLGIGKKGDHWELVRCASNTRVNGGASKLLKFFIDDVKPNKIISYSLNDYGIGTLYSSLGFEHVSYGKPSYWYVDSKMKQYHRYNFSKHKLVEMGYDENKTEFEITDSMGLLRIYDSGSSKWVWNR